MKNTIFLLAFCSVLHNVPAQTDPMLTSWWFNTTNTTYAGTRGTMKVNVEAVYYTTSIVYVKSSGVPSYYLDGKSHFDAADQTNVFKLPRTQTVTTPRTYLRDEGAVAVLIDGSVALSPCDGHSYNNADVWHQLAYSFEGNDFDTYKGHSTPGGQYHHHINPTPLYSSSTTTHSGIVGYAFDGYPIYGPYAYTNTNGTGAIKRMTSSWAVRNITDRTTLPDGSTATSAGPAISSPTYTLGKYFEDYAYTAGSGDLDQYNGRTCVTPEYPSGTYCYFITLDASLNPAFPYIIGDYMYGTVQAGNMGPTGGNNTIPAGATLPVELSQFTANPVECAVDLAWTSQSETKVNQYELESSADGQKFTTLNVQPAKGGAAQYNFRHSATSLTYYRLKMVDLDGQFKYSTIVSATNHCIFNQIGIKIYPNPVVDAVTIENQSDNDYKMRVYNATGAVIYTADGHQNHRLDMTAFPKGTYIIEVVDSKTKSGYMQRVVKY
ncbi:MAG: hypothetical protein RLZZ628_4392 [Bacteroidota bacterium]|jgi:hypothetical protein